MRKLLFLFSLSVVAPAWAYPVFFTCNADKSLSDLVTPEESARALNRLLATNATQDATARQSFVTSMCEGGASCMRDLEQIMAMAQAAGVSSLQTSQADFAGIRERAQAAAGELAGLISVPAQLAEAIQNSRGLAYQVALARECREVMKNEESWLQNEDGICVMANSRHSPYMYPSGIRDNNSQTLEGDRDHSPVRCEQIDVLVSAAVGGGHDPYTAVAVSLMENATDVDSLYLDPIGVVGTLGCTAAPVACSQTHNLNSYETCYNVQYGVRNNPKIVDSITNYLRAHGDQMPPGQSFYCNNSEGGGGHVTGSAPTDACCVRLPFDGTDMDLDRPVVIHSFSKYFRRPIEESYNSPDPVEKPARRLQRYNGYSRAMGGAERVSTWRAGVNYYNSPAYGYQAMDYLLNTVMNNPYVVAKVREAEAATGKRSPSILCEDLAPGSYAVDSEVYFNRHKNAPRLSSIKAELDAGKTYNQLSSGFRNVLRQEIEDSSAIKRFPELTMYGRDQTDLNPQTLEALLAFMAGPSAAGLGGATNSKVVVEKFLRGEIQLADMSRQERADILSLIEFAKSRDPKFKVDLIVSRIERSPARLTSYRTAWSLLPAASPELSEARSLLSNGQGTSALSEAQRNLIVEDVNRASEVLRYPMLARLVETGGATATLSIREYFNAVWHERNTVGEASQMDEGFSWNNDMSEAEWDSFMSAYRQQFNGNEN